MEKLVKKYQQKYRRAREEMGRWDELQSRLLTQFENASAIVQRWKVLLDPKNYGVLTCVQGIEGMLSGKQMESLHIILHSMEKTMLMNNIMKKIPATHCLANACVRQETITRERSREGARSNNHMLLKVTVFFWKDFESIVKSLEKIWQDGIQLSKGGSMPLSAQQMQLHVGIRPSLAYCVEGLRCLHDMHLSEYLLKSSIVSAFSLNSSSSELAAFHQILADQPNIPREEVQYIFDIIFSDEIS